VFFRAVDVEEAQRIAADELEAIASMALQPA
jgi:hypothetical protein